MKMMALNSGENLQWLHGNTVGVGVGVVAYAYKYAKDLDLNEILKKGDYLHLDKNKWLRNITEVFTVSAKNIIEFKQDDINFNEAQRKASMDKIVSNWDAIKKVCDVNVPSPEEIIKTLKKAGAVWNPSEVGDAYFYYISPSFFKG